MIEPLEYRYCLDTLTFLQNVSTTWNATNQNWYDPSLGHDVAFAAGDIAAFDSAAVRSP